MKKRWWSDAQYIRRNILFELFNVFFELKIISILFPAFKNAYLSFSSDIKFNRIFYETNLFYQKNELILMKKAGINSIQSGIESFSDDISDTMKKGISGLQNIQLLK